MTPQEIRNGILKQAITGKLSYQSNKEIVDIKKIDNKKNKKIESFEFDIPENWIVSTIEGISITVSTKKYQIKQSEVIAEGKYPVISQSNEYVSGYFNNEDILYRHINPVVVFGDHTTVVKYVDFDFVVGADGLKIFEPNEIVVAKYLYYCLIFMTIGLEKIGGYSRHYKFIKDKGLPIPPLAEQDRIIKKIEELLPLVDEYEKNWEKLEALNKKFPEDLKKSLLQEAIKGKLVEQRPEEGTGEELYKLIQKEKELLIKEGKIKKQKALPEIDGEEIPFDIPESWKWVRLQEIIYNHGQEKPSEKFSYIDIGSIDNSQQKLSVKENIIIPGEAPSRARKIVKKGDILYSTVRPYLHNMCIVDKDFKFKPIASTGFAVMSCYKGIYNKFLFYYLLSPNFDSYANNNENSKEVAYPAINDKKLYKALVPLPPLSEQKRIIEKLDRLLPYIDKLSL